MLFPAGLPQPSAVLRQQEPLRVSKHFCARWDAERSLNASPEADVTGARARKFKVRKSPLYEQQGYFKEGEKKSARLRLRNSVPAPGAARRRLTRSSQPRALFITGWRAEGAFGGNADVPLPNPTEEPGSALAQGLFGVFRVGLHRLGPAARLVAEAGWGRPLRGRFLCFKLQQMLFLETRMDL